MGAAVTIETRESLLKAVLDYFSEARISEGIEKQEPFASMDVDKDDLRAVYLALHKLGFLRANDLRRNGRASAYEITEQGRELANRL